MVDQTGGPEGSSEGNNIDTGAEPTEVRGPEQETEEGGPIEGRGAGKWSKHE